MKIFTAEQIRRWDAHTIQHEPIASLDLMERAAAAFFQWFGQQFDRHRKVFVFAGPGNNGGDGLAIARLLSYDFYEVEVWLTAPPERLSPDAAANLAVLQRHRICPVHELALEGEEPFPRLPAQAIVVDAMFGSGLDRAVTGRHAALLEYLNEQPVIRVAVDVPSGMFADRPTEGVSLLAHHTVTFEAPKLAFFLPENRDRTGDWIVVGIGLHRDFYKQEFTQWHWLRREVVKPRLHRRHKNDHKGTFGHALLVAGSYGKIGAAILATRACLRSGAGLVTVHTPKCGYEILQIAVPEAMVSVDEHQFAVSHFPENLDKYKSVGIGCGIGTGPLTATALSGCLKNMDTPLVLDADALNLLAANPDFFGLIPPGSILTPHPKEFERMFGETKNGFGRIQLLREKAQALGVYLILKGAHTAIATPDGHCWFNSTGNPGMATGGSGDVLTGILTGLLAQGYTSLDTCLLGVYLHGLAGDLAAGDLEQEALVAGDITLRLGKAFLQLKAE